MIKIYKIMILSFLIASLFTVSCTSNDAPTEETPKEEVKSYDIIVDSKGTGDFTTVQAALNSVAFLKTIETKILIKNGTYKEKLELSKNKNNISLIGESKENVILTYDDYASKKNSAGLEIGTSGSASFIIAGDNFKAKNITFE